MNDLSVDQLKKALESLDWNKVKSLLDVSGGSYADINIVSQALQRSNKLIFKYSAANLEKKRQSLFSLLTAYFASELTKNGNSSDILDAIEILKLAESGYRCLVECLDKTEASKLDPALHVAAVITRSESEANLIWLSMTNN